MKALQSIEDRAAIIDTINAAVLSSDMHDWTRVRAQFADYVFLDYSSLAGGTAGTVKADDLVANWKELLPKFTTTQHVVTNHRVALCGENAQALSQFVATHRLAGAKPEELWVLGGHYRHALQRTTDGWKIARMTMTWTWQSGNGELPQLAQDHAQGGHSMSNTVPELSAGLNHVYFQSENVRLAGNLYLPSDYKIGTKLPAIVVAGSWTTVKEQMAGIYAQKLAAQGFAALAFDFRFFGESSGEPRQYESPTAKIRDIRNAVTYLCSLDAIAGERIGVLGICAGAAYMAMATAADNRVKSFVAVAPWLHDAKLVKTVYGGEEGIRDRIKAAASARQEYEKTGYVEYVPISSTTDKTAAMFGNYDYYLNPKRGAIPAWKNQFAVQSWDEWLEFSAIAAAKSIRVPALFVHSEQAAIPEGAKRFMAQLSTPKKVIWIDGTQLDFYDQPA